jgi:drug/metabolite transporter (DMT)-like permease
MIILLLIRHLSPRARTITGVVLAAAGLALVGLSVTLAAGLLVHGIALTVIGAVLWTSAIVTRRRARLASQAQAQQSLAQRPKAGVL